MTCALSLPLAYIYLYWFPSSPLPLLGACPNPPCGEGELKGIGPNTFSSGLEGPWTLTPTVWTNSYFKNLLEFDWIQVIGPGGGRQFAPRNKEDGSDGPEIVMLVSDVALLEDKFYLNLVK